MSGFFSVFKYLLEEELRYSNGFVTFPRGVGAVKVVLSEIAGLMEGGVFVAATWLTLVGIQQMVLSHVEWTIGDVLRCLLHTAQSVPLLYSEMKGRDKRMFH